MKGLACGQNVSKVFLSLQLSSLFQSGIINLQFTSIHTDL